MSNADKTTFVVEMGLAYCIFLWLYQQQQDYFALAFLIVFVIAVIIDSLEQIFSNQNNK